MTGLLARTLQRVEALPKEKQDAIGAQILETLDDEAAWMRRFHDKRGVLRRMANEAVNEHRRGETRPLDELLG